MTKVLVTIDTELSALLYQRGMSAQANLDSSIHGKCDAGAFGIGWQMDQLDSRGLKGVFFVDPLPALVYGEALISDIVGPILARGHDVQLHVHTEWLEWATQSPIEQRGHNLADFSLDDQMTLIRLAAEILERAGAPRPVAFRAGNYGADDNSLRALATLGLRWDTSFNAPFTYSPCRINLPRDQTSPCKHLGIIELPVSGIWDRLQHIRPAQICAMSAREMREALDHAGKSGHAAFVIVTHSFEMLSRDRARPNRSVMSRFESMCRVIADHPGLHTSTFAELDPDIINCGTATQPRLAHNLWRTGLRMVEQALATWRYE
jgi:hypothetical protein